MFACIPGQGYVGVGIVSQPAVMVGEFVPTGCHKRLLDLPLTQPHIGDNPYDPETAEWIVGVSWIRDLPQSEAIWEPRMFANQNTACRLRNQFTIERLIERFGLDP